MLEASSPNHRPQGESAMILHFGEMVAVDHRQRIDAALDRGIGRGGVRAGGAAGRGKLMRLAITWRLFLTRWWTSRVSLVWRTSPSARSTSCAATVPADRPERLAQLAQLLRRQRARQISFDLLARHIGGDFGAQSAQRTDQQMVDDQPADRRRRRPHQDRQQQRQQHRRGQRRATHTQFQGQLVHSEWRGRRIGPTERVPL